MDTISNYWNLPRILEAGILGVRSLILVQEVYWNSFKLTGKQQYSTQQCVWHFCSFPILWHHSTEQVALCLCWSCVGAGGLMVVNWALKFAGNLCTSCLKCYFKQRNQICHCIMLWLLFKIQSGHAWLSILRIPDSHNTAILHIRLIAWICQNCH